jgi:hypothetical protein
MGIALALVLAVLAGAHVSIVAGLAQRHIYGRAVVALMVPPLAPWWSWEAGLRRRTMVWGAALALYTLGATILAVTRT